MPLGSKILVWQKATSIKREFKKWQEEVKYINISFTKIQVNKCPKYEGWLKSPALHIPMQSNVTQCAKQWNAKIWHFTITTIYKNNINNFQFVPSPAPPPSSWASQRSSSAGPSASALRPSRTGRWAGTSPWCLCRAGGCPSPSPCDLI